ncbi:hypothetical protein TanjilG_16682 [Lupinus angustifolius]|uniref:Uncharacterized protein n=1 Tax=Lupinus angustifolius TaxID=3871 RepID=A0A4P1QZQ3_LUPAN|nr:hypothetical protein TanjilG_16682 [Lupinus angustifolius]
MASNSFSNYEGMYDNLREPALVIGGCCVLIALVLSIFLIFRHLRSYTNPAEQKWIVAVISMVPIYATESILSLWNPRLSLACDILRNYYEAFALYSFGRYLISCLGGERRVIELLEEESEESHRKPLLGGSDENHGIQHSSFCNFFCHPCMLGKDLLTIEKFGLVQYMILKTVCAFLALILELCGVYGDGEFKWYYGFRLMHVELRSTSTPMMAIAAVAHVYVFSAEPYHFLPASAYGKVTEEKIEADVKIDEGDGEEKSAVVKETTTQVEAPRTSVKESVQDIVVEGGQRVVKDVALTINQAIGPVEKGVTRIQQTFHHKTVVSSDDEEEESDIKVEKEVTENVTVKGDENA